MSSLPSVGGPWIPPTPDGETDGKKNPPIEVIKMMEEQGRYGIVISGVISWIEVQRHNSAGDMWKEVAKQCWNPDEVTHAKKQLVTILNKDQIEKLKKNGVKPTRHDKPNPNDRKKTEIDDIEHILDYLSTNLVMPLVLATSCQIRMSPKCLGSVSPEANMGELLSKVHSLENCMNSFMTSTARQVETLTEVVTEQRTLPTKVAEFVSEQRTLSDQISKTTDKTPAKKRKLETEVNEIEVVENEQEMTYADLTRAGFNPKRRSSVSRPPTQSNEQLFKNALMNLTELNTKVKEKTNNKPKSKVIFHGKAAATNENDESENNLAADVELVAFNVFKDAEPEHLEKFLKDKGVTVKDVKLLTRIELITSGAVRSKSIKVTLTAAEHKKAMNPNVWPYRVGVRYYKADKPRKSDPENAGRAAEHGGLQERDQHDRGGQAGQEGYRGKRRGRRNQFTDVGGWQVQNKSQNMMETTTEITESCP